MISAKEAHKLANSSKKLDNIMEDIEASIEAVAEDGGFETTYTIPRHLESIIFNQLTELGYMVLPNLNIMENNYLIGIKIIWRMA